MAFFSPTNPATYEQRVVCQAAADKQYISPGTNNTSAFAEFSADRLEGRTVTGGPSYQVSVEDPISAQAGTICPYNENDIDLANGSHGRGMLQRGANRWARGSRCWISEIYEEDPWSVRWTNRDQILTHYYTGIHIRDVATRAIRTPTYRWVPLRIDWGTSNDRPPIFTAGGGYTINVQVQNTSTAAWSCGSPPNLAYNLTYRWVGQTTYDGAQRVSVCGLTPSAAGTVPLTLSDIPDLPGNYSLQFDITVTTSTGSFKFSDPGYGWSSYKQNVRVCPGGVCAPRQRDFVFVIDTTQSMNDNLADLKMASNNIVNGLLQSGDDVRIAVVDYRDFPQSPYGSPGDYAARLVLNFSADTAQIANAINSLTTGDGNNWPESVFSGLMTGIELPWRSEAERAVILMGDAPPHDPEPFTGYTSNSVIAAVRASSGTSTLMETLNGVGRASVRIHTVEVEEPTATRNDDPQPAFERLANETGGTFFRVTPDTTVTSMAESILFVLIGDPYSPIAVAGGPYTGAAGSPLMRTMGRSRFG
jgi:hypothetical protein